MVASSALIERVFIPDEPAGGTPIVAVLPVPAADITDNGHNRAIGIYASQAGVEDGLDIVGDKGCGDHGGEQLCGLGGLAGDADVGIVQACAGGGLRHRGCNQAECFTYELAGDVEIGPGIQCETACQRRVDADVHEPPDIQVGAPDMLVYVFFP